MIIRHQYSIVDVTFIVAVSSQHAVQYEASLS